MTETYLESLNKSLRDMLKEDESVYILGEDILDPYGGAFKVTNNLSSKFPERVLATPISEAAFVGIGLGMAMQGLEPIVEIMFGDFITLAADQIINHASKFKSMYSKEMKIPLVLRTPMGGYRGYGPTHSQSLEKHFFGIPNIDVIAPSHFHNPGELLKNAVLKKNNPTLFIEHKLLYPKRIINENKEFLICKRTKIGNMQSPAAIVKNYKTDDPDIVLITYGGMSLFIEPLMEKMYDEEIKMIAYLPSDLSHFSLGPIENEFRKCKKAIIIEEGTECFNWGSEIASQIYSEFEGENIHIQRISSVGTIIPAARHLERKILPSQEQLEEKIMEVLLA